MIKAYTTTGIGSLPHRSAEDACRFVLDAVDIPFWPQLPNISFREFMVPQYAEGLPFFRIDAERNTAWVEKNSSDELERFYEGWSDTAKIAISADYAQGLHAFLRIIKGRQFDVLKGHVTGPMTFTLGLKDAEGRPVYFDEEFREISLMLLKAKVRWQIDLLKAHAKEVIIFIDEPILSALGSSSYLGVNQQETERLLSELVTAIRAEGAIPGIHCCGNADWPLVIKSRAEIINFDAYDYADTVALYPEEFGDFIRKGGYLAWGIVPTSDKIGTVTPETVLKRFERSVTLLSRNIDKDAVCSRVILTPSCGAGSRTVNEAIKIFQILMRLKEELS